MDYLWPLLWADVGGGAYDEGVEGAAPPKTLVDCSYRRIKAQQFLELSGRPGTTPAELDRAILAHSIVRRLVRYLDQRARADDRVVLLATAPGHELATAPMVPGITRFLAGQCPGLPVCELSVATPTLSDTRSEVGDWLDKSGKEVTLFPIPAPAGICCGMVLAALESAIKPVLVTLRDHRWDHLDLDVTGSWRPWFERMRLFSGLADEATADAEVFTRLDRLQRLRDPAGEPGDGVPDPYSLEGIRSVFVDVVRRGDLRGPVMARAWLTAEVDHALEEEREVRARIEASVQRRALGPGGRRNLRCFLHIVRSEAPDSRAGKIAEEFAWIVDHVLASGTHAVYWGDRELVVGLRDKLHQLHDADPRNDLPAARPALQRPLLPTGHVLLLRSIGRREKQTVDGRDAYPLAAGLAEPDLWKRRIPSRLSHLGIPERTRRVTCVLLHTKDQGPPERASVQHEQERQLGVIFPGAAIVQCVKAQASAADATTVRDQILDLVANEPPPDIVISAPISGTNELGLQSLLAAAAVAAHYGVPAMYLETEGWVGRQAVYHLNLGSVAAFPGHVDRLRRVARELAQDFELETAARVAAAGGRALERVCRDLTALADDWLSQDVSDRPEVELADRLEPMVELAQTSPWWGAHLACGIADILLPRGKNGKESMQRPYQKWLDPLHCVRNASVTSHGADAQRREIKGLIKSTGTSTVDGLLEATIRALDPRGERQHQYQRRWVEIRTALGAGPALAGAGV